MIKVIISTILAAALMGTTVHAAEAETTVTAGLTPDKIFYSLDKAVEDLQLLITTDDKEEAELLLKFAKERLAEAEKLTVEDKTSYVEAIIEDYKKTLEEAETKILEVVESEEVESEVKDELTSELQDAAEVDESIEEVLSEEAQQALEETVTEKIITANVVKGIEPELVKKLREQGLGLGQIAQAKALAELSGKSIDEVAALFTGEEVGLGDVAKQLGIHPSEISKKSEAAKAANKAGKKSADAEIETAKVEEQKAVVVEKQEAAVAEEQEEVVTKAQEEVASKEIVTEEVKEQEEASDKNKGNSKAEEKKETQKDKKEVKETKSEKEKLEEAVEIKVEKENVKEKEEAKDEAKKAEEAKKVEKDKEAEKQEKVAGKGNTGGNSNKK